MLLASIKRLLLLSFGLGIILDNKRKQTRDGSTVQGGIATCYGVTLLLEVCKEISARLSLCSKQALSISISAGLCPYSSSHHFGLSSYVATLS